MASVVMPRVAVLGGGVAGCAAASRLSRLGAHVTLVEMGRGVGGRAATRKTREDKRIEVDHGAPVAEIMTPEGLAMVQELSDKGHAEAFTGTFGQLRPGASSLQPASVLPDIQRFSGTPNQSAWCQGLLDGASVQTMFGGMVRGMDAMRNDNGHVSGWRLFDKEKALMAECDWLVVSGNGVAHSRWRKAFGGEPPLAEAAIDLKDPKLDSAIAAIEGIVSSPVQAVLLGFEGDAAKAWSALPFSIAAIEGDETIAKISLQRRNDMVFVVAHSTHSFADTATGTYGSTSTAARVAGAANDVNREQEVLAELIKGVDRCLSGFSVGPCAETATFGPLLHFWGNAFPQLPAPFSSEDAFAPASRVIFAGDYVGQRTGSIEGAMLSGVAAAELLMAHVAT
jgi:hypothetical protein